MGYLTTITFYNDGASLLKKDTDKLAENIYQSCLGTHTDGNRHGYFGHGNHVNIAIVQQPRHADDHTCYVHMGNTLTEMSPYSKVTMRVMEENPDFFDRLLFHMQANVKELKKMRKAMKEKQKLGI